MMASLYDNIQKMMGADLHDVVYHLDSRSYENYTRQGLWEIGFSLVRGVQFRRIWRAIPFK